MFISDELVETQVPEDLNITVEKAVDILNKKRSLPTNNNAQDEAIREALRRKFTIIQGPPGKCQMPMFFFILDTGV